MMIPKAIAGDYFGDVNIQIGTLWHGPSAAKFKGLHFVNEGVKYDPEHIKRLVYISDENIQSFLDSALSSNGSGFSLGATEISTGALSGGNQTLLHFGIEFSDGRKIILVATDNRILQCLLLFAEAEGIIE